MEFTPKQREALALAEHARKGCDLANVSSDPAFHGVVFDVFRDAGCEALAAGFSTPNGPDLGNAIWEASSHNGESITFNAENMLAQFTAEEDLRTTLRKLIDEWGEAQVFSALREMT